MESIYEPILNILKNGYYIPYVHLTLYLATNDAFLSTIVALKMYPANFFYWHNEYYSYETKPEWLRRYIGNPFENRGYIKQIIRFTDTGHLISFMYWLSPDYMPMAFITHFVITTGYWSGQILFGMKDANKKQISGYDNSFEQIWSGANHGLILSMLAYRIPMDCVPFTSVQLYNTVIWNYSWLLFVYFPWRYITEDPVYNVLSKEKTWLEIATFLGYIQVLTLLGWFTGYTITSTVCPS
jgi:hypothetical protein